MKSKIRSVHGNRYVQTNRNGFGYIKPHSMEDHNKQSIGDMLLVMIQNRGIMKKLHADNASEMVRRKPP